MKPSIKRLTDKFPEPEFSRLRKIVFRDIEYESAKLEEVVASERAESKIAASIKAPHHPMVRFGAYIDEQLVGWSSGWLERGNCFYMASSGVAPEHRNRGIYSALLEAVLFHARELGAQVVRSQHSVLNKVMIVCKLRRDFYICGLSASAQMGNLVELVHHIFEPRFQLFRSRVIPFVEPY